MQHAGGGHLHEANDADYRHASVSGGSCLVLRKANNAHSYRHASVIGAREELNKAEKSAFLC